MEETTFYRKDYRFLEIFIRERLLLQINKIYKVVTV
jgi:hypothetical protein